MTAAPGIGSARSADRALGLAVAAAVTGAVGAVVVLPVLAGLWISARLAFGAMPALDSGPGGGEAGLAAWRALLATPGLGTSVALTLITGFAATALSLALALALTMRIGAARTRALPGMMLPLLATPHAAMAIGLAFLIAPSGWLARLISPWLTGWQVPPDIASVGDPWGLALILGLAVKEVPFLALVSLAALGEIPVRRQIAAARSLGHGAAAAWLTVVLPQLYGRIRLPVLAVLAFSLSVVDMAIVLGPSNPGTLAVEVVRMLQSPDLATLAPGAAGGLLQVGLVAVALPLWCGAERALALAARAGLRRGLRMQAGGRLLAAGAPVAVAAMALGLMALAGLALWSVAGRWRFPHPLPADWSLSRWLSLADGWQEAALRTFGLGLAATVLALLLAVGWLAAEGRFRRPQRWLSFVVYLPLTIPQVGFLFGLNVAALRLGLGGSAAVIWGHLLYVFPYVTLALAGPWRAIDPRIGKTAAALGAGPLRRLVALRLPILLRPLMVAGAVGFAVSVAQYLPTLFLGAGRIATLTTEAVTLSSGSDRRVLAIYASLQSVFPLLAFAAATAIPALLHRNRRGLRGGGG